MKHGGGFKSYYKTGVYQGVSGYLVPRADGTSRGCVSTTTTMVGGSTRVSFAVGVKDKAMYEKRASKEKKKQKEFSSLYDFRRW